MAGKLQVAIVAVMLFSMPVFGESGQRYTAPSVNTFGRPSGYLMNVDTTWVRGHGYRPIRVEIIDRTGAVTADTELQVQISTIGTRGQTATATGKLVIPEGNSAGKATISVPQFYDIQSGTVRVYEYGSELQDLFVNIATRRRGVNPQSFSTLFIDRDAPTSMQRWSRREIVRRGQQPPRIAAGELPYANVFTDSLLNQTNFTGIPRSNDYILNHFDNTESICLRRPADLPDRWIDLTCFDMAVVSWDDAQYLKKNHPDQWDALRDWAATGPTLVVYGIGSEYEKLAELEKLLGMAATEISDPATNKYRGWNRANLANKGYVRRPEQAIPPQSQVYFEGNSSTFVIHPFRCGQIIAMSADDPYPGTARDWGWVLNTVSSHRWNWGHRHGFYPGWVTSNFDEFLIPGVGRPPVNAFRILITLFVLVIGPVNYHVLRRAGRLYLLLLTVPLGAAVITFSLIGYAFVSDGLGVRARVRSFTHLDQASGRATSWSRQSYYAGFAPSRGLEFPGDTAVYRFEKQVHRRHGVSVNYGLQWNAGGQQLSRGYIQSRITSQFLVLRSRDTRAQLVVKEPRVNSIDAAAPPDVENLLRTKIHALLLIDSNGEAFGALDVDDGSQFKPKAVVVPTVLSKFRDEFNGNHPRVEEHLRTSPRRSFYYDMAATTESSDYLQPQLTQNILEQNLKRLTSDLTNQLKPRSYIAIVEQSPEVPLGTKSAKQESSFHVIQGSW